jgi:hypothetical protein
MIEFIMKYNIGLLMLFTLSLSSCDPSSNSDKYGRSNNNRSLDEIDLGNNKGQDLQKQSTQVTAISRDRSRAQLLHRLTGEWDGLSKDLSEAV